MVASSNGSFRRIQLSTATASLLGDSLSGLNLIGTKSFLSMSHINSTTVPVGTPINFSLLTSTASTYGILSEPLNVILLPTSSCILLSGSILIIKSMVNFLRGFHLQISGCSVRTRCFILYFSSVRGLYTVLSGVNISPSVSYGNSSLLSRRMEFHL